MTWSQGMEAALFLAVLILLAWPAGLYIKKIMMDESTWISARLSGLEKGLYRISGISRLVDMNWKQYFTCVLLLSGVSFAGLWVLLMAQGFLPGNPNHIPGMSWHLALNTALSFVTNTNWQAYSAEGQLSYLSSAIGLTVQNFLSAAVGICLLFALIRGFIKENARGIGNFWQDMTRSILYVLLPFSLVISILLMAGGVIQNFSPAIQAGLQQPVAVDENGTLLSNAVIVERSLSEEESSRTNIESSDPAASAESRNFTSDTDPYLVYVDGKLVKNARVLDQQLIPMGPAASQIAIKQLGSNGGGFFGANSAHPLENPGGFTNFVESASILLLPMAMIFAFGSCIRSKKQAGAIFASMLIVLCLALFAACAFESRTNGVLNQPDFINTSLVEGMDSQAGGNMEGKESRFGISGSSMWSVLTTATSSGSVNASMNAQNPGTTLINMLLMQCGEVIFGGAGSGLYSMLGFILMTVFIAGLMVGRTPEFLGKKIEPAEMKWAVILCMSSAAVTLITSAIAALVPGGFESTSSSTAHAFSQLLYAFTSAGANNGSAMNGFNAAAPLINVLTALAMAAGRILPALSALAIAGSLVSKKKMAISAGVMSTDNALFASLLLIVILLVGALSFFPALALGPIAEMTV